MTGARQPDQVDRLALWFGVVLAGLIGLRIAEPRTALLLALGNLALALAAARLLPALRAGSGLARFFGLGLPLLLFYALYLELDLVLSHPSTVFHDGALARLEWAWWQRLSRAGGPAWLGELMAAAYMSYVPFILAVLAVLGRRGRTPASSGEILVRRICISWAVCYTCFATFPVLGPHFLLQDLQPVRFGNGPFSALALFNQQHGMLRGAAFPSAHIAATFMTAWTAWWCWRPGRLAAALLALAITASTVYLGYHYIIDVVGGVAVGLLATAIELALRRRHAVRVVAWSG